MTLFYYALWMLCGIGTAVLSADAALRRNALFFGAGIGFSMQTLLRGQMPDIALAAGITVVVAVFRLVKPGSISAACAAAAAGLLTGVWASLIRAQGVPAGASLALALVVPIVSAVLAARHPDFAPHRIRDEALLILTALAAVVGLAPGLLAGWQSAGALNLEGKREVARALPSWTILTTLGAVSLGGLYSVWTRR